MLTRKLSRRARLACGCYTGHVIAGILSCLLCALWFLWPTMAKSEGQALYCIANAVNVRESPVDGYVLLRLDRGDLVLLQEEADGWCRIDRAGDIGWVKMDYLSDAAPDTQPSKATVTGGRLALRDEPDGKRTGWLKDGQAVEVLGERNGWARVRAGDTDGWADAAFLEALP